MDSYPALLTTIFDSMMKHIELKVIVGMVTSLSTFLLPMDSWQAMLALLALVTFDFIMGVAASKKAGCPITGRKMAKTPLKIGIYGVLVSSAHLTNMAIDVPIEWFSIQTAMIGFLAATELVSILENSGRLGFAVPKKLLNQLNDFRGDEVDAAGATPACK
jgi:phage-related holin